MGLLLFLALAQSSISRLQTQAYTHITLISRIARKIHWYNIPRTNDTRTLYIYSPPLIGYERSATLYWLDFLIGIKLGV